MDIQFWIGLIVAIVFFISKLLKKTENPPPDMGDFKPDRPVKYNPNPPQTDKPKALTFEELFREITEAKLPKPSEEPVKRVEEYVDYDETIGEEDQDLEEVEIEERRKDPVYSTYEEAKREAFVRPSLEETLNVRDTKMEFGKFKVFAEEEKRNLLEEYTKDFQDPEGFKKAVVMSEILNRKF